jgi:hypothetical protein
MNLYGYAGGDPINNHDPFGLHLVGKIVLRTIKALKTVGRGVDEKALVRAVTDGEDVLVGSQQQASRVARAAGDGARPVGPEAHNLPGGGRGRSHYHPAGRTGGHVFYGIASGLTLSRYAEGRGAFLEGAAAVGDFFNPLGIGKDVMDIYLELRAAEKAAAQTAEKPADDQTQEQKKTP